VQENHATGQPRRFAIALKETDRLIGGVGLDGTTGDGCEEPALGYWLGQPYWGKGYAREAAAAVIDYGFRTLGLEMIRAYTGPGNAASQKVLLWCLSTRRLRRGPRHVVTSGQTPVLDPAEGRAVRQHRCVDPCRPA
jgi:RimJ/RimL family protein N-acetyltransferase